MSIDYAGPSIAPVNVRADSGMIVQDNKDVMLQNDVSLVQKFDISQPDNKKLHLDIYMNLHPTNYICVCVYTLTSTNLRAIDNLNLKCTPNKLTHSSLFASQNALIGSIALRSTCQW